jgi:beta-mannosidase
LLFRCAQGQQVIELDSDYCDWYFSIGKSKKQFMAIVPGSNINDLVCNQIIPQPYINNNTQLIKWVEDSSFTYSTTFNLEVRSGFNYEILCEGLDTYAEAYLNNQLVLKGNNMFVAYKQNITKYLREGTNLLKIVFRSAVEIGNRKARQTTINYPADNEEGEIKASPFVRKSAFQFGWDINPRLISCGIWQPIKIIATAVQSDNVQHENYPTTAVQPFYHLRQVKDAEGESFAFFDHQKKSQQHFMYGANYVPYNMYPLPIKMYKRVAHIQQYQGLPNRYEFYRHLFNELHNYGCNMLRVWGGGWYEDDYFYSLADSLHIAVWQDFMFANTMYPGDEEWMNNVKEEVAYQVSRLKKHPCIVLFSGNNEIQVAWNNWGWQRKYHYSMQDSLKLINDYLQLFEHIIPEELKKQQVKVHYISSSPVSNWGRSEDFKKGDNHYWGIWHGEAPFEDFYTHVPRFASEYGMPSCATDVCINKYSPANTAIDFTQNRMKSYKGTKLLHRYIADYLPADTHNIFIGFASRYIQLKALKTAYNAHLYHSSYCAGSLFWQFNESWPGVTWAVIDFSGQRKIPPYASNYSLVLDKKTGIKLKLNSTKKASNRQLNLLLELKDIKGTVQQSKMIDFDLKNLQAGVTIEPFVYFDSTQVKNGYLKLQLKPKAEHETTVLDTLIFIQKEKEIVWKKPVLKFTKIDQQHLQIISNVLVCGVYLTYSGGEKCVFNQNFLSLEAGVAKIISVQADQDEWQVKNISYQSIYNLQNE